MPLLVDIEHRDLCAVLRQRFGEPEPEAARAAGDDDAVAFHLEQVCDFHEPVSPCYLGKGASNPVR